MKVLAAWGLAFGFAVTVLGARCLYAPEALDKDFVQVFGTIFGVMGFVLFVMSVRVWRKLAHSKANSSKQTVTPSEPTQNA